MMCPINLRLINWSQPYWRVSIAGALIEFASGSLYIVTACLVNMQTHTHTPHTHFGRCGWVHECKPNKRPDHSHANAREVFCLDLMSRNNQGTSYIQFLWATKGEFSTAVLSFHLIKLHQSSDSVCLVLETPRLLIYIVCYWKFPTWSLVQRPNGFYGRFNSQMTSILSHSEHCESLMSCSKNTSLRFSLSNHTLKLIQCVIRCCLHTRPSIIKHYWSLCW